MSNLKKIGYYISKDKCLTAYKTKTDKLVNYKNNKLKKGTKIYKSKTECNKAMQKKLQKKLKKQNKFGALPIRDSEMLPYGDGQWEIHCTYLDWGPHATVRYLPLGVPGVSDFSYHYGFYHNGRVMHWASGMAHNTPIPNNLKNILENYFNTRCLTKSLTKQRTFDFYNINQYDTFLK